MFIICSSIVFAVTVVKTRGVKHNGYSLYQNNISFSNPSYNFETYT